MARLRTSPRSFSATCRENDLINNRFVPWAFPEADFLQAAPSRHPLASDTQEEVVVWFGAASRAKLREAFPPDDDKLQSQAAETGETLKRPQPPVVEYIVVTFWQFVSQAVVR